MKKLFSPLLFLLLSLFASGQNSPGVVYSYFEGSFNALPNMAKLTPAKYGTASNFSPAVADKSNNYAVLFQALLNVPTTGNYTFEVASSDGAKFYFGSYNFTAAALVNNDGIHASPTTVSGTAYLKKGNYPLSVAYFVRNSSPSLSIYWTGPGVSRQLIPASALSHRADQEYKGNQGGLTGSLNYYFSSSTGDDSRTATQAQSPLTPWKTLAKFATVQASAPAGTAFLFKRGEVFEASQPVTVTADNITLSAYGTGAKPQLTGLKSLLSWQNVGTNLWESDLDAGDRLEVVTIRNAPVMRGRWPNPDSLDGFLHYDGHQNFDLIFDNSYQGRGNWDSGGTAELVMRSCDFQMNIGRILAQSGGTFQYPGNGGIMESVNDNYGYFIQNDPRTLDRQNEWFYNKTTKKLRVYSSGAPANIRAAVVDTILKLDNRTGITLDNIEFTGSDVYAVSLYGAAKTKVRNCNISRVGLDGLHMKFASKSLIENDSLTVVYNNAIEGAPMGDSATFNGNFVEDIGLYPGGGRGGNLSHLGFFLSGTNILVTNNTLHRIGYHGIAATHSGIKILYNRVDSVNLFLDDAACIYVSESANTPGEYRYVVGNVVSNAVGNRRGKPLSDTSRLSHGIYVDETGEYVYIDSNIVSNMSGRGIFTHDARYIKVRDNKIYNAYREGVSFEKDVKQRNFYMQGMELKRNLIVSDGHYQTAGSGEEYSNLFSMKSDTADFNAVLSGLDADANVFVKPFYPNGTNDYIRIITNLNKTGQTDSTFTLNGWKAKGKDLTSTEVGDYSPKISVASSGAEQFPAGDFSSSLGTLLSEYNSYETFSRVSYAGMDGFAFRFDYTGSAPATDGISVRFVPQNQFNIAAGDTIKVSFDIVNSINYEKNFYASIWSDYNPQAQVKYFKMNGSRKHVDLIFPVNHAMQTAFFVIFSTAGNATRFWMDNYSMKKVSMSYTNPANYLTFKYAGFSAVNVTIPFPATDEKGQGQASPQTLSPRTGKLFMLAQ